MKEKYDEFTNEKFILHTFVIYCLFYLKLTLFINSKLMDSINLISLIAVYNHLLQKIHQKGRYLIQILNICIIHWK